MPHRSARQGPVIVLPSEEVLRAVETHPCYNDEAHRRFARMHLPVAPACNIQCNYCNRKYDCSNESRPGVTSDVLTPRQASDRVGQVLEKVPELKVIGIAGPGDPLANEATFETIDLVRREHPGLTLCISTNGLALPGNAKRLYDLGVRFVTITMNAVDPAVGAKVYGRVTWEGRTLRGEEAASLLLERQLRGLDECVALGMAVKINIVMIPGVNADHIPDIVREVRSRGAYSVNILPLIPVEGTAFEGMEAPTPAMRKELMDRCEGMGINVMRHCKQCRADAIGKLGEDRSQEFACGSCAPRPMSPIHAGTAIAVASSDGENVDCGFGNAPAFYVFGPGEAHRLLRRVDVDTGSSVSGDSHRRHIEGIIASIGGAGTVVVSEIGPLPAKVLGESGVKVVIAKGPITDILGSL